MKKTELIHFNSLRKILNSRKYLVFLMNNRIFSQEIVK